MPTGLVVMAYGTPSAPDEVEAYYTHIRRGRPPSPEQLADLQRRYAAIGGVSPLAERTRAQVEQIDVALEGTWPVALGYKHASPFIEDAVASLADRPGGEPIDRVVGLVLAPHFSRGSVGEYHARASAAAGGHGITYAGIESWCSLPAWIDAQAARVRSALGDMPGRSAVLFTAHSLPERVIRDDPYPDELRASAAAIAAAAGLRDQADPLAVSAGQWALAWQSAGRTPEPWRGPDVVEVIRGLGDGDLDGVVVCPQGFVSDHLEVLYDLDVDARRVAADVGLAFGRAAAINDDPAVMAGLADLVRAA
jgi:ferrochelatase